MIKMLITIDMASNLEADGEETYKFINQENCTAEMRQKLKEFDESCLDIYGFHIITNYEDLGN
ncbi:Uncharacterised protein [Acetobacterium wieringae]|uniref:hypothetical protein n=1 Tax=Acetobacterium wieringae TaxID=52694 RepID=UPI001DBCB1FF|nr:hypothetical protein [Acetobacterium wieringae]VUZ28521.1 Uncharacterised protein [Acetobacterium wieringae]